MGGNQDFVFERAQLSHGSHDSSTARSAANVSIGRLVNRFQSVCLASDGQNSSVGTVVLRYCPGTYCVSNRDACLWELLRSHQFRNQATQECLSIGSHGLVTVSCSTGDVWRIVADVRGLCEESGQSRTGK